MTTETERYAPGLASLATEVLRTALADGVKPQRLEHSLWATYLRWHTEQMQAGKSYKRNDRIARRNSTW